MTRRTVAFLLCCVICQPCRAQAIVVGPAQVNMDLRTEELQNLRFGMFICWSYSTFSGTEWTRDVKSVDFFNPTGCDTDQWCRTAKQAAMGYILFLTKHHDGFCLWDTKTTDWKVTKSPLGIDVLAKLRRSCDQHGLKLALYFSEGDWTWPGKQGTRSGPNPEMKKAQLTELLTQYGPIEYLWLDHAAGDGGLSHAETAQWVKQLQPGCFVGFNSGEQTGADIRLGEWGSPGSLTDVSTAGVGAKYAQQGKPAHRLAEFTYPIFPRNDAGARWFYTKPQWDDRCLSAEHIYQDYLGAKKYGNIFSLDVGPMRNGKLRPIDVKTLQEIGWYIRGESTSPSQSR